MRARAPRCGAIMTERRDHGRQGRQERQGKEQAAAVEETGSAGSGEAGQGPATDQQQVTDQRRWVSEPEMWVRVSADPGPARDETRVRRVNAQRCNDLRLTGSGGANR